MFAIRSSVPGGGFFMTLKETYEGSKGADVESWRSGRNVEYLQSSLGYHASNVIQNQRVWVLGLIIEVFTL